MMTLRALVVAWQVQEVRCKEAFDAALVGINRELDAVGGFATTTPEWKGEKGYCRDYWRQGDSFGGGVSVAGEKTGPENRYTAPCFPEVGDRCFAMEQAWRKEALALTEAVYAVRKRIAEASGIMLDATQLAALSRHGVGPENIALALVLDNDRVADREAAP